MAIKPRVPNEKIRYQRELRGWSQQKLVELLGTNMDRVSRWECGESTPSPYYREKLVNLFEQSAEDLGIIKPKASKCNQIFASHTPSSPNPPSNSSKNIVEVLPQKNIKTVTQTNAHIGRAKEPVIQSIDHKSEPRHNRLSTLHTKYEDQAHTEDERGLRRRDFILAGTSLLAFYESPDAELLNRFLRALRKPSTIDKNFLNYLETRIKNYWQDHYNAILTSSDLFSFVLDDFQKVTLLLEEAHLPTMRLCLCTLASEIAQLLGTLLFDMSDYKYSSQFKQAAIIAAQEAGQQELEAVAWGRLSMALMYDNNLQEALICIQKARHLAITRNTDSSLYTWLAAVEAEIQSKLDNRVACLKALDDAKSVDQQSVKDSYWLHFDRSSLVGYQGVCFRRLYQSADPQTKPFLENAQRALMEALTLPVVVHRRPTIMADLADIYIQQKEIEEACRLAIEAASMTQQIKSQRNIQRLLTLRRDLEPWKNMHDIKRLDEHLLLFSTQR